MFEKWQKLRASGLSVFDRRTVANVLGIAYASTNPVLDRLVRKGVLVRLMRDRYVLAVQERDQTRKIANELVKPSAISLWTALSDAGVTTQVPRVIQSVTPKRSSRVEPPLSPTFTFVHLPASLFFGNVLEDGIWRAVPEKALLDILYVQRGALDRESINASIFDKKKICLYAKQFPTSIQTALSTLFPIFA